MGIKDNELQLNLDQIGNPNCPFTDFLDPNDTHCYNSITGRDYDVLSEDNMDIASSFARIGGPDIDDIIITSPTPDIQLPSFVPVITNSSGYLLPKNITLTYGVNLNKIPNYWKNLKARNIRDILQVPSNAPLILFCYGKDSLIEEIWPKRDEFYKWVSKQNFNLVTGINYSIWDNHPHGERLYNLKRNLLTYDEMRKVGIPAVPHIYWYGEKDIERLQIWINNNPKVKTIAINTQTHYQRDWEIFYEQLRVFTQDIPEDIHFIISGPTTRKKIAQLKVLLPNITIANSKCALNAAFGQIATFSNGEIIYKKSKQEIGKLLGISHNTYDTLISNL